MTAASTFFGSGADEARGVHRYCGRMASENLPDSVTLGRHWLKVSGPVMSAWGVEAASGALTEKVGAPSAYLSASASPGRSVDCGPGPMTTWSTPSLVHEAPMSLERSA